MPTFRDGLLRQCRILYFYIIDRVLSRRCAVIPTQHSAAFMFKQGERRSTGPLLIAASLPSKGLQGSLTTLPPPAQPLFWTNSRAILERSRISGPFQTSTTGTSVNTNAIPPNRLLAASNPSRLNI